MTGVVNYDAGNITSVCNALDFIGVKYFVSNDITKLDTADRIIMPGVGEAQSAMSSLEELGLVGWLKSVKVPFLGICLGMQALFEYSDERNTKCLGLLEGTIKRFKTEEAKRDYKIPHMGWNKAIIEKESRLFSGIKSGEYFYFVHSYYAPAVAETVAVSDYGIRFTSSIQKNNYYGVQFHPEKSGEQGLKLLTNFVELC